MAVAAMLALVGHAVLLALMLFLSHIRFGEGPAPQRASASPIALLPVSAQRWAQNRGAPPSPRVATTPTPEKKKEPAKPEARPEGQVVDVAPGNGETDPQSKYLAESNNTVKKETRAKEQTAFYRNAMPQKTSPHPSQEVGRDPVEQPLVSGNAGLGDDDRPLQDGSQAGAMELPDVKARSEVAMRMKDAPGPGLDIANRSETAAVQGNSTRLRVAPGTPDALKDALPGSRGRAGNAPVNLLPSAAVIAQIAGAAPNDHLRDVDEGEGTFLNTREWKYASFFNRLKQSIGHHWDPNSQLRLRDPTGQVYAGRDRETTLKVTLDGQGRLRDVYVDQASGLDFLDVEAVQSFERAQPFPNPPPGLADPDGLVRFAFGFHVTLTNSPGVQLFR